MTMEKTTKWGSMSSYSKQELQNVGNVLTEMKFDITNTEMTNEEIVDKYCSRLNMTGEQKLLVSQLIFIYMMYGYKM